jgi:deoxyribodipyrimidine photo-lyase
LPFRIGHRTAFDPLAAPRDGGFTAPLAGLRAALETLGAELIPLRGAAFDLVDRVVRETGAEAIYWNRRHSAAEIAVDSIIKSHLAGRGITARSFNGRLIYEPWEIKNQSGRPFQVFTPLCPDGHGGAMAAPEPAPERIRTGTWLESIRSRCVAPSDLGGPVRRAPLCRCRPRRDLSGADRPLWARAGASIGSLPDPARAGVLISRSDRP